MTFTTGPDAARPERISTRLLSLEFQARIWTQDAYTDGADRLGVANTPASKTYQLIDQRHATVVYVPSQRKIATRNEGLAEDHLAAFEARLQDLGLPSVIECHSIPPADVQDFRWTLKPDMWTADTGLTAVHFASYPHPTPQSLAIVASSAYGRLHSLRGLYLTPTELVDVSSVIQDLFPSLEVMEFSLTIDDSDCPVPPNLEPIFPLTKSSLREVSVSMHSRKTPSVLNATILLATIGGRQTNFKYIDSGFDHHFEEINDMVHYLKYLSVAQQKSLLHSSWAELDFDQDQESFCADNAEDEDEDGLSSLDKWYPWMRTSLLGLEWHEDGEPIPLCESAALRHLYDANNDKTYREQSTKIRESIQAEITESASLLEKRGWTVRPYEWSTGRQLAMKSSEIGVLDKKITEAQAKLDELEAAILVAQARLGE